MKKVRPSGRGSSQTRRRPGSIDDYLAGVPPPARGTLKQLRATIRSAAPKGTSETISYGMPAFRYKKVLFWFAAFSDHCSLFPTAAVIAACERELKDYATTKGTVHFPLDKPLPAALVRKLVKVRLAQIEGKNRY